ncbi:hypothetical protein KRR38_00630 [Novosphingobium sp. G106]|uniref:hypothetical protein n=1 Tax=Novosphingobium sp. G106 TaxID=2849500 RepID=UPI001C2D62BC|nr:hypothetical protein [Novosphingobium sp. G106]MBV1686212.1 hypothetical protein [Novosphingobium sp. G106]
MKQIAHYEGRLLNPVETLYWPGERQLAFEPVEALGCVVTDTGFKGDGVDTFLAVDPNRDDQNVQNNVFYMSQIRPEQLAIEERLQRLSLEDDDLAEDRKRYRQAARTVPLAFRISLCGMGRVGKSRTFRNGSIYRSSQNCRIGSTC